MFNIAEVRVGVDADRRPALGRGASWRRGPAASGEWSGEERDDFTHHATQQNARRSTRRVYRALRHVVSSSAGQGKRRSGSIVPLAAVTSKRWKRGPGDWTLQCQRLGTRKVSFRRHRNERRSTRRQECVRFGSCRDPQTKITRSEFSVGRGGVRRGRASGATSHGFPAHDRPPEDGSDFSTQTAARSFRRAFRSVRARKKARPEKKQGRRPRRIMVTIV